MSGFGIVLNGAYSFAANGVDLCSRLVKQTDGLQLISQTALTALECLDYFDISTESPIVNTLKTVNEVISARKVIPRLNEITSGDALTRDVDYGEYNFVRLVSRIAYVIQDAFKTVAFLEKLAVIAAGTGNAISLFVCNLPVASVIPIIGFVGVTLDLADTVSIILTKGLDANSGLNFVASVAKLVVIGVATTPSLMLVGIVAAGTSSLVFFVKFVKAEYKI
jgi:hypothetical protein